MLHSSTPAAFIPAERLAEPCICPECNAPAVLAIGVIHIGHYKAQGEVKSGLIWTCSDLCFLKFESLQFMGRA